MKQQMSKYLSLAAMSAALFIAHAAPSAAQSADCRQPKPVCDAIDAVFAVSAFDPVGSAVRISPNQLVTARHVVADETTVRLFTHDGVPMSAKVLPTDFPGDLVLLKGSRGATMEHILHHFAAESE